MRPSKPIISIFLDLNLPVRYPIGKFEANEPILFAVVMIPINASVAPRSFAKRGINVTLNEIPK